MPDAWEAARGLDPNDAADGARTAPSGYTWVEEYLDGLIASCDEDDAAEPDAGAGGVVDAGAAGANGTPDGGRGGSSALGGKGGGGATAGGPATGGRSGGSAGSQAAEGGGGGSDAKTGGTGCETGGAPGTAPGLVVAGLALAVTAACRRRRRR